MGTGTGFYKTKDVRAILGIGNKTCLELFHRADFPCVKVGRTFLVSVDAFEEYFRSRRMPGEAYE